MFRRLPVSSRKFQEILPLPTTSFSESMALRVALPVSVVYEIKSFRSGVNVMLAPESHTTGKLASFFAALKK